MRRSGLAVLAILALATLVASLAVRTVSRSVWAAGNEGDNKNVRRIEWVDEKGVKHITLLSQLPSKAPTAQRPASPAGAAPAPIATPSRAPALPPQKSLPALPAIMTTRVEKVVSGDIIVIQGNQKLRYVGLRAPAKGEPGYEQALAYHKKLVEGKFVNILFDTAQRTDDGAIWGFVFINQLTFVNAELIRNGYAHANPQPPNIKYQRLFDNLEKRAQSRNLGIWRK